MINETLNVADDDRLINEKELAKILGCGVSTLQQARVKGEGVPYIRVGHRLIRYRMKDVRAYLSNLQTYRSTSEYA